LSRSPIWTRAYRRLRREIDLWRHSRSDRALLSRAPEDAAYSAAVEVLAARLGEEARARAAGRLLPREPAELATPASAQLPGEPGRTLAAARELLADRLTLFDVSVPLIDTEAWHRDISAGVLPQVSGDPPPAAPAPPPESGARWPLVPHGRIRLTGPRAPGDVRLQWEPARFHHALILAQAYLASGDDAYPAAFCRQVDAFLAGNPPFRGIHWSVGMEVAIRAAAWGFALEFFRGAAPLNAKWRRSIAGALLLHGLFLETHIERHPLGFTTNHTLSDYAGLAVLGRLFAATPVGERWRALASAGLTDCLDTQVLAGGGHAEASLPYERFVLEAALVAARCLDGEQAAPLRRGIHALARHLRAATMASGLPFIGDGDDSFFPPFACTPHAAWDPLDPEPVLHIAAGWCGDDALRGERPAGAAAHWLSPETPGRPEEGAAAVGEDPEFPTGFHRFSAGPLVGLLIQRDGASGWLPTHGHNDLLALLLEIDGAPLLIDPGTGAYGLDPRLRHTLRSTAAHSTLQLDEREQSRIEPLRLFEGPRAVVGGLIRPVTPPSASPADEPAGDEPAPPVGLPVEAWHEGFGKGFGHLRRISHQEGILWIEDRLGGSQRPMGETALAPRADHRSTLRFRIAPGLILRGFDPEVPLSLLDLPERGTPEGMDLQDITVASRACVEISGREVEFLLLRPARALWQIGSGAISRRYGSRQEGPILQAQYSGPLPHRWLAGIRYRPQD
jgi:hypothetical protein